jgi:hypothetical protein
VPLTSPRGVPPCLAGNNESHLTGGLPEVMLCRRGETAIAVFPHSCAQACLYVTSSGYNAEGVKAHGWGHVKGVLKVLPEHMADGATQCCATLLTAQLCQQYRAHPGDRQQIAHHLGEGVEP